jgi:hypothetical protein
MGLPLDTCHRWFIPAGRDFSDPEMLIGRFVGHEGVPSIVNVRIENAVLRAIVNNRDLKLVYCGGLRFLGMDPVEETRVRSRLEFFTRNGHAWGVRVGSRIFGLE